MNQEKLKKLQSQIRIGGKGTPRRKKKIVHQSKGADDKKIQGLLKKLNVNTVTGTEEANMIKNDGTVIHFKAPKVQASLATNTFVISGTNETKRITDLLPGILTQLGSTSLSNWSRLAKELANQQKLAEAEDDDVPKLVHNFEDFAVVDEEKSEETETKKLEETAL
uniref:Transcription factor BTF3 n=1 Tax=Tabanus bromius TaxID=304241 RepID=A0A0K8TQG2_TABBR